MRKLFVHKVVTLLLLFSIPFVSISPYLVVVAEDALNIIDRIILQDMNGNNIDSNSGNSVELDGAVRIIFEWSIKQDSASAGDTYTMQIPKEFKIYNEVQGELLTGNDGISAGTFYVSKDGLMTITFNDFVENHSLIQGEIQLSTHFNKEVIIENNTNIIIFDISENMKEVIEVDFTPDNTSENIIKSHSVDSYNPSEITWEIKVNKQLATLENVRIDDVLSAGQELIEDSVEIHKLYVNLDGTDEISNETFSNFTLDVKEQRLSFSIIFNESIDEAYVIRYKTKITDFNQSTFANNATLTADGTQYPTVEDSLTIKKGSLLQKSALSYDHMTKEVTWKVLANYREADLGELEIKDSISAGHQLIPDSIIVKKVTINSSGNATVGEVVTSYTVKENDNGFSILFDENESSQAYEIIYKTKVTDSTIQSVTNTVDLISNGDTVQSSQSSSSVTPPVVANPVILEKRTTAKFDYNTRLQNWTITVNSSEVTLASNTTITDTFPDGGMLFIPSSLVIKDASGNKINEDEYSLEAIEGDETWEKGFIIRFHSEITKKYLISYQTKMNPATHKPSGSSIKFKNVAVINTEINGESVEKKVTFNTTMND